MSIRTEVAFDFCKALGEDKALLSFVLKELQVSVTGDLIHSCAGDGMCKVQLQDRVGALLGTTASAKMLRAAALRQDRVGQLPAQVCVIFVIWLWL